MYYQFLSVAIGGMTGALCRYWIVSLIGTTAFPWATLVVNFVGSFLIGIVYAFTQYTPIAVEWRLFLQMGLLGGFTTFSTLSLELLVMFETRQFVTALIYIICSIAGGVIMAIAGSMLYKASV